MPKIAVVRVRGKVNIKKEIRDTLDMLRLYNKNYCVILEATPQNLGMINRVKDYVTYGEISEEFFKEIIAKRGKEYKGRTADSKNKIDYSRKFLDVDGKKYKKYFRLSPPVRGYGRKGIKKSYSQSGALGNRKEKIVDLIKRMI